MNENKVEWPISNEDKKIIQDLGRTLHGVILEYAKKNNVNGSFHAKFVSGAFQYIQNIMGQKAQLVADDFMFLQDTIERLSLGDFIVEPFTPVPPKTLEQLRDEVVARTKENEKELANINEAIEKQNPSKEVVVETPSEESNLTPSNDKVEVAKDEASLGATA